MSRAATVTEFSLRTSLSLACLLHSSCLASTLASCYYFTLLHTRQGLPCRASLQPVCYAVERECDDFLPLVFVEGIFLCAHSSCCHCWNELEEKRKKSDKSAATFSINLTALCLCLAFVVSCHLRPTECREPPGELSLTRRIMRQLYLEISSNKADYLFAIIILERTLKRRKALLVVWAQREKTFSSIVFVGARQMNWKQVNSRRERSERKKRDEDSA